MMRALIVTADNFEDSELVEPLSQLQAKNLIIDIAAPEAGIIQGKHGTRVTANIAVQDASAEDYDLLLLPGGKAPIQLCGIPSVIELARHFIRTERPIAAICHGPQILIATGLLAGRTATGYLSIAKDLKKAGVLYHDREVVVDRNLITSRHPKDLPAFIKAIYQLLGIDD